MRKIWTASAAVLLASTAVVAGNAAPALAASHHKPHSSTTTLTPGLSLSQSYFSMRSGGRRLPQHATLLRYTLSSHLRLDIASPGNVTGANRMTVLSMARQEHAIAGLNGDTMYFSDPKAVPRGGTTHNGTILKSALQHKNAALWVTRSGVAHIGNPGWSGSVTTSDGKHVKTIQSINSLENASHAVVSLTDHNLMSHGMRGDCMTVELLPTSSSGVYRVAGKVMHTSYFSRPAAGHRKLVTCGRGMSREWLTDYLVAGHYVRVSAHYGASDVFGMVSGKMQLVRNGRRYTDHTGLLGYGKQRKPQSFACIMRNGRSMILGTVGGDTKGVAGMTNSELTSYLLSLHCWSAMNLDGSGSSTLVAAQPHHGLAVVNHTTAHGGPRRMVNGLFLVRR